MLFGAKPSQYLQKIDHAVARTELIQSYGKVTDVAGQTIISDGPHDVKIGEQVRIEIDVDDLTGVHRLRQQTLHGEVVGFQNHRIIIMPLGNAQGIQPGARVLREGSHFLMPASRHLIGRVLNGLGQPIDQHQQHQQQQQQQHGHLSGHPTPPHIDRLAATRGSDGAGGLGVLGDPGDLGGPGDPGGGMTQEPPEPMNAAGRMAQDAMDVVGINGIPPLPTERPLIDEQMITGVRAIDGLLSIGRGQRVGIFAGTGVGKSTLLGMIARYTESDVNIICLVGERGREVRQFIEKDLGTNGMKRSIVFATTGDRPAMEKIYCGGFATSVAEYFRDQGKNVNFYMDSVTRYAMALREVSIAAGEPLGPSGYPPSVWYKLSRLVERTGNAPKGSITAFYAVLVEADDMNDPVADNMRGVLDGHVTLSRRLAQKNHFPAIEIGESISRVMNQIISPEQSQLANHIRHLLATYKENEEIISLGAYVRESNPLIDEAIEKKDLLDEFLGQSVDTKSIPDDTMNMMRIIVRGLPEESDA